MVETSKIDLPTLQQTYASNVDGELYLQTYNDATNESFNRVNNWHIRTFIEILEGLPKGGKALDFGCGPYIADALILSTTYDEIYVADYSAAMRAPMENWVKGRSMEKYKDNEVTIKYVSKHAKIHATVLENTTRYKIKGVLACDMHKLNPLPDNPELIPFNCIVSRLVLDCSPDLLSYKRAVRNVSAMLGSGGHWFQIGFYDENGKGEQVTWTVGDKVFVDLQLSKQDIIMSGVEAGLELVTFRELPGNKDPNQPYELGSTYVLCMRKK